MVTLENEFLKVIIRNKGAEIISFYNKRTAIEHLWQGDPDIWEWHAPNLFPVVGGNINNQIVIDGKNYEMPRHGFARHTEFTLLEQDELSAKFSMSHNENTILIYPYKFAFQIIYTLKDSTLQILYKVINYDDQSIYFSLGAHPAFNIPFFKNESKEDYYLEFEQDEPLISHLLSPNGFFNGDTETLSQSGNTLPITENMFANDALVFKDLVSRKVTLKSNNHLNSLYIEYPGFNYLGIWAKNGAPFICLEPWLGCADTEGKKCEIRKKEGIHKLDKGHVFEAFFNIGIT